MPDVAKTTGREQELPQFPGEHPARHAASQWMEKLQDQVAHLNLQTAMRGELPLRVQHMRNWPEHMTTVPAEVEATLDAGQLYKAQAEAAKSRG